MENNKNISEEYIQETNLELKSNIKFEGFYLIDSDEFHKVYQAIEKPWGNYMNIEKEKNKYKIWKRKVICDYYADSYITFEETSYTIEQLKMLNDHRLKEYLKSHTKEEAECEQYNKTKDWTIGTLIFYRAYWRDKKPKNYFKDTNCFKGEIIKLNKGKNLGTFDIRIGDEIFRYVSPTKLEERKISHNNVFIPATLKELATKRVLGLLREITRPRYSYWDDFGDNSIKTPDTVNGYTEKQLRAELSTREHIPRKNKKSSKEYRRFLAKQKK